MRVEPNNNSIWLSRGSQARAVATQDPRGIELLQAKEKLHAV